MSYISLISEHLYYADVDTKINCILQISIVKNLY